MPHEPGRGFPDGDDRLSKRRHRPTKLRKVAPFEATANDGDDAARKALNRATGCLDVGSLRIVNESNTTDLTGRLHHVGEAMEPSQGRGHCRGGQSVNVATAVAASTLFSMWRPVSSTADRGTSRCSPVVVRLTIQSPSTTNPSEIRPESANRARPAATPRLWAITVGSSALTTAQSSAVWLAKMRALAAAYDSTLGCRSR